MEEKKKISYEPNDGALRSAGNGGTGSFSCAHVTVGVDVGSTTAKIVAVRDGKIVFERYERHLSAVRQKTAELLREALSELGDVTVRAAVSGSAGLGVADAAGIPFIQEVAATTELVRAYHPDTEAVIELGGEDAKIVFFGGSVDERMNGTCAGGTGAFIDQMATLLDVTVGELDALSLDSGKIYPIASRCGVFAKTDIQPLLNQGARKEDVAASIYQAVVNQTIAGLAQGRRIRGKVLFFGGPLFFCEGLRKRFRETLGLSEDDAVCPPYARHSVSLGASLFARDNGLETTLSDLCERIENCIVKSSGEATLPPLFESEEDYKEFAERHARATVETEDPDSYSGRAYLGIDCGSTTTKLVLLTESGKILYSYYSSNRGNPVEVIKDQLGRIYSLAGDSIEIAGSAVTGYGEDLIKNAFGVDIGVVETAAHYTAAKRFMPDVDFILDIGGQDIKCFRIRNGAIDSIMLNEACSSGCGSFIETFARSMGYTAEEFAKAGLFARAPVNLGSRCTVFMNSSVKQAQKDGAGADDISAGLSISVVKNALYKVIRATGPDDLGEHVVVQGGTLLNDAVLRALERELGRHVVRPAVAGLMGAYGAALKAMNHKGPSGLIPWEALENFTHKSTSTICRGCTNNCHLTVNTFSGGGRFISGNRCERGLGRDPGDAGLHNLYNFKRKYLTSLPSKPGTRGTVGIPLSLGMYELLPLWHGIFSSLGYEVSVSGMSTRATYEKGQFTIPSDTACYPAKIMHGHVEELVERGVDLIFYPCITYNVDEKVTENHFNCPVVAYYSELLAGNLEDTGKSRFFFPYLNINKKAQLEKELFACLGGKDAGFTRSAVRRAVRAGFSAQEKYYAAVRREGEAALAYARENNTRIMILAGRPYHVDEEICHGIDRLALSLGFVVVSEDSVAHLAEQPSVRVLNQWTYHGRLYRAARYAAEHGDTELVQLVSFGCGVDAITTDEVRRILEDGGKYCTQIKIDEITNLGAVKIRLRSLLAAIEEKEAARG
ncbi:MAG: 2-hydroxyacyl-CoA dehydratase [Clostridia bacterium]|nr:2-hydroxyacyl-CoA dehydratase [Clostridia bacterium]